MASGRLLAGLLLSPGIPFAAVAQVCAGFPLERGPVQLTAGLDVNDHGTTYGGGAALGGRSAFGRMSIGVANIEGLADAAFAMGLEVGFPLSVVPGPVQVCPTVFGDLLTGSTLDFYGDGSVTLSVTEVGLGAGVQIGGAVAPDRQTTLIPTAFLAYALAIFSGTSEQDPGIIVDRSETFAVLGAAVSAVFGGGAFLVRAGGSAPIGLEGGVGTFHVGVGFTLGRRRASS